ncbi:alpha-2-macroglobulin-like protein 1 [Pseudophryne corroboree]|uniref:alpha-2-macroglobulin-like protein 1 n=1 Tax=Pseudophryne corroboree TaxID=495146 RepID=UPI0030820073
MHVATISDGNVISVYVKLKESEKFALNDTEDVVLGSKTAEVTVTGDIMGRPLDHLDNLLQLPHGCGEQNMIKLGPVIATILYFSITGQLTDEISEKAQGLMEEGYQNELNFRHTDGSYSAFGNKDPSGNSWLTAFVARVYFLAEQYISVNYTHISECLNWLKSQQQEDGCFKNVGSLIHRELQGGVDSATALTAYITATFVLIGDPQYDDVINKAKTCLGKCTEPESSTYTKAQCAYTFTLLGDTEKRTQLLKQLNTVAIEKDYKGVCCFPSLDIGVPDKWEVYRYSGI